MESPINGASDWYGEYGDTHWPLLDIKFLNYSHM